MSSEVGALVPSTDAQAQPASAAKRRREPVVLDEDDWVEKIEAIIQRDYFPDLPKLESELEWLGAVRSKDPVLIRQAQANIVKRRAGLRTPMGQTPADFGTPATQGRFETPGGAQQPRDDPAQQVADMSLDKFMAKHMSEDNASFKEILDGINKRRREKYAWVHGLNRENETKLLEDARPQDGFGTTGQPSAALLTAPPEAKNGLYDRKDAVPYTEKELAMQVQGPPKQIRASNTRLPGTHDEEVNLTPDERPKRGDEYDCVATPAFTPGPDAPPPMTWGHLEATPARIEDESAGPRFKVPDRKPKDLLAHRLADGARLNLQKRAALVSPSLLNSLQRQTPRIRSKLLSPPATGSRPVMSPAAHRLATSIRGKTGLDSDTALRASYSRSSLRKVEPSGTPAIRGQLPSETPAILHDHDEQLSRMPRQEPSSEELQSRQAALNAFEPSFVRRDALRAFGKITDGLLD